MVRRSGCKGLERSGKERGEGDGGGGSGRDGVSGGGGGGDGGEIQNKKITKREPDGSGGVRWGGGGGGSNTKEKYYKTGARWKWRGGWVGAVRVCVCVCVGGGGGVKYKRNILQNGSQMEIAN